MRFFLSLLIVLAGVAQAGAQQLWSQSLIGGAQSITNGQTLTLTNAPAFNLHPGRGVAVLPTFSTTNTDTSTLTFAFDVSHDGSTWTTSSGITGTGTLNGTNTVRKLILLPPTTLDNVLQFRLTSIANGGTNTVTLSTITANVLR